MHGTSDPCPAEPLLMHAYCSYTQTTSPCPSMPMHKRVFHACRSSTHSSAVRLLLMPTYLQVGLSRGLLGEQLSMQVVVLHVQVRSAAQPAVASNDDIGGQAAQSLGDVLQEVRARSGCGGCMMFAGRVGLHGAPTSFFKGS